MITTIKINSEIGIDIVPIPGGETTLGPCQNNGTRGPHEPLEAEADPTTCRVVRLKEFWMGKYPVTQAQYLAVMGDNPTHEQDQHPNNPVSNVPWDDVVRFCAKLSDLTGLTVTLPSEAQWEHACRAGTTTRYHCGNVLDSYTANYDTGLTRNAPTEVGSYPPNAFGLFDMHGNVSELCLDPWYPDYTGMPADGGPQPGVNPYGLRVIRGGSFYDDAAGCASNYRNNWPDRESCGSVGFRIVCLDQLEQ